MIDSIDFKEAARLLSIGGMIHDVRIGNRLGTLMTRELWLDCVADGGFIDYDGMGDQVNADGEIIGNEEGSNWIHPSNAADILPETAFILWYNR